MSTTRTGPTRTDVPTLSWLASRWLWTATLALSVVLLLLIGLYGLLRTDLGFVETVAAALADPWTVLAVFVAARALAFALAHRRREHAVLAGELAVTDDASVGAVVSVASFSVVGLLAAAVPLPLLYSASGNYRLLAVAVGLLTVPAGFALLVYQLGELLDADRYRRGYRVVPAVYHYLWTLPLVVVGWFALAGLEPVPVSTAAVPAVEDDVVHVGVAELSYLAAWTPTAVAFGYACRRFGERLVRGLLPG